jgi:hypothetical protein
LIRTYFWSRKGIGFAGPFKMKMVSILHYWLDFKAIRIILRTGNHHFYEKLTQPVPKTYPSLRRF